MVDDTTGLADSQNGVEPNLHHQVPWQWTTRRKEQAWSLARGTKETLLRAPQEKEKSNAFSKVGVLGEFGCLVDKYSTVGGSSYTYVPIPSQKFDPLARNSVE